MAKNILVIGDLMIDHYLWGECERISPEAPVQIIDIQKETILLGGAGNVVNNLKALKLDVSVVSVIGDDDVANELSNMLDNVGATRHLIIDKNRQTSKKSRIIASHQQVVRYDIESKEPISKMIEDRVIAKISEIINQFDMIILSDYGKGLLTDTTISRIISLANQMKIKILVDPKGNDYTKYKGAYLLTPNKKEAQKATGITILDKNSLINALNKLQKIASLDIPLITLSEDGVAFLDEENNLIKKPTVAREVFDVTGAGDTVISALAYSLVHQNTIEKAVEFANLSAGVVVGKLGSATATLEEIEEYKSSLHKSSIESHIKSFDEIKQIVAKQKIKNKKIVFTNGCFDILHRGHVSYLDTAKSFGDILIVGLNSDESVRRLKGESRPINIQDDRGFLLAALESVDYVVNFEDDTPYNLIKLIEPDILVKGADYEDKEVIGSDIVDEVRLVTFVNGKSTTQTIKKIQQSKG